MHTLRPAILPTSTSIERGEDLYIPDARKILSDLFTVRLSVYIFDFVLSAGAGWSLFALALGFPLMGFVNTVLLAVSTLFLFRALMFLHPVFHLSGRSAKIMRVLFTIGCGVPLLAPFSFYESTHKAHHRKDKYGTKQDGEYLSFVQLGRKKIAVFVLVHLLLPYMLFLRFILVTPLSFLSPSLRNYVISRLSAFAVHLSFIRPLGIDMKVASLEEWITSLFASTFLVLTILHVLPVQVILQWTLIGSAICAMNTLQFLALHRYDARALAHGSQIEDSLNTVGRWPLLTSLWAPVGQRFHALHHCFPTLPYYNLPEAHRRLLAHLPQSSVYHNSSNRSLFSALLLLWNHAGAKEQMIESFGK